MPAEYNLDNPAAYDPSIIYKISSNRYGVGRDQRTKYPEYILAAIASIVQKYPHLGYRTSADFMRDSSIHRLHYWQEELGQEGAIEINLAILEARQELRYATIERYENLIKRYQAEIQSEGLTLSRARVVKKEIEEVVDLIPEMYEDYADKLRALTTKLPPNLEVVSGE